MASPIQLKNNAIGRLASGVSGSATTLTLVSGDGAKFPTLTGAQYFPATLIRASDSAIEIVKVTARSGDVLTVVRAQEGTTGLALLAGDRVELRFTAGTLADEIARIETIADGAVADAAAAQADAAAVAAARAATQAEVDALETTKAPTNNPVFTGTVTLAGDAAGALQAVPLQQLVAYIENQCFDVGDYKLTSRTSFGAGRRWLLCDNKTIGSATSGATALASAEAQALFEHLWTTYDNTLCPIQDSTGAASTRGASATADFTANKRMPLLDWRGLFPRVHHSGSDNYEVDVSRALGSLQGDEIRSHSHGGKCLPPGSNTSSSGSGTAEEGAGPPNMVLQDIGAFGGAETRPRNRSLNMFIRY